MVRVALIGDSQLTDSSPRPVTKLGTRLRRRGHRVETLAVDGLDTRRATALRLRSEPADWTLFCFGANDLAPWKRVPPDEFANNYESLVKHANSRNALVVGPAPVAEVEQPGARTNRDVALYSAIAAVVARRCGAWFIPLLDHLGPRHLAGDGVHLNDRGYDVVALLVTNVIEPSAVESFNSRLRRV